MRLKIIMLMSFVYFVSLLAYGFEPFSGDLCDY